MKNKFFSIFLIVLIFFNSTIWAYGTNTDTLNSSKEQFKQIGEDIKTLDIKISSLNDEISKIQNIVNTNNKKIKAIENNIKSTEQKILSSKSEIDETEVLLSSRLRELYKNGSLSSINYVSFIIESKGFSDLISRIVAIQKIISMDNKIMANLKNKIASYNKDVDNLSKQKYEIDALNEGIKKDLAILTDKQDLLKAEKAELNKKKNSIASLIEENEDILVRKSILTINSENPSLADVTNSVINLKGLLPQLTSSSVVSKTKAAISKGEELITKLSSQGATPPPGGNGNYKKTYTMEATAYYGHSLTAMGTVPVRDPNGLSTVAVDRNVIPLGSKLYIPNYGYAIAADTGGAIKGMKIDLFMNTREECYSFGRRNVTVHLVALPGEW